MAKYKRVTQADIARAVGCDPTRVSLALNGLWRLYRFNPDLVEKILETAKEMGYESHQERAARKLEQWNKTKHRKSRK